MLINGRVALITGAARGLGKHFAQEVLGKGAAGVCLVDYKEKLLSETCEELGNRYGRDRVCAFPADVAVKSKLEEAFSFAKKRYGKLHIVCNNAGVAVEDDTDAMFAINLLAVYRGTVLGIDYMRNDKPGGEGGVIVNVSSMAGLHAATAAPVYTATKHGVVGLSRAMGNKYRQSTQGVRINCLCPSFTDTDMVKETFERSLRENAKEVADYLKKIPLIRPEVVTEGFINLVEDESKNGEVLMVLPDKGLVYRTYHPSSRM